MGKQSSAFRLVEKMSDDKKTIERFTLLPNRYYIILEKVDEEQFTLSAYDTTKIEDADLIGYTKARSEGFTAKKNSVLVAKPPKRMKNKGFLKPR